MIPKFIIIHHSASPQTQTAKVIDDYHKSKWNFKSELGHYAGYQYIIEKSGNVFQARKDTEAGAHTVEQNMNYQSIGICVVGWYDDGHDNLPTKEQQTSLAKLLNDKMAEHKIPRENVKFHRDYSPKTCPGTHITQEFISNLIKPMEDYSANYKKIYEKVEKFLERNDKNPNDKEVEEIIAQFDEIKTNYQLMAAQNSELRGQLVNFDQEVTRLKTENEELKRVNGDYEDKIENQATQINVFSDKIENLKKQLESQTALSDKQVENTRIVDAISYVFKVISARIKSNE